MVCPTPTDLLLRPVHPCRHGRHGCIYFHLTPFLAQLVCQLSREDDISFMVILINMSVAVTGVLYLVDVGLQSRLLPLDSGVSPSLWRYCLKVYPNERCCCLRSCLWPRRKSISFCQFT